jgi:hypothetical protein
VTVNELLGGLYGGAIVRAAKVNRLNETAVMANDVNAVVLHAHKFPIKRMTHSLSPITAETGAVMETPYTYGKTGVCPVAVIGSE